MSVEAIAEEACSVTTDHYTVCTYASGRRLSEFNRVLPGTIVEDTAAVTL
jgi:hypothetical protein